MVNTFRNKGQQYDILHMANNTEKSKQISKQIKKHLYAAHYRPFHMTLSSIVLGT